MVNTFDEARFRQLWRDGEEILRVRANAETLLHEEGIQSFDGLGHFLDRILPRDVEAIRRVAEAVRISTANLQRLRAGSLDPLMLPPEALAELGQATALDLAVFADLLRRDHQRFASRQYDAVPRDGANTSGDSPLSALERAWKRGEADSAHDL